MTMEIRMEKTFVRPLNGARIRQLSNNNDPIPQEGIEVELNSYYLRHIKRGELEIVPAAIGAAQKSKTK